MYASWQLTLILGLLGSCLGAIATKTTIFHNKTVEFAEVRNKDEELTHFILGIALQIERHFAISTN
jgi:glucose-6-phosphate-specific signal transduction histidine kinase